MTYTAWSSKGRRPTPAWAIRSKGPLHTSLGQRPR